MARMKVRRCNVGPFTAFVCEGNAGDFLRFSYAADYERARNPNVQVFLDGRVEWVKEDTGEVLGVGLPGDTSEKLPGPRKGFARMIATENGSRYVCIKTSGQRRRIAHRRVSIVDGSKLRLLQGDVALCVSGSGALDDGRTFNKGALIHANTRDIEVTPGLSGVELEVFNV